MAAAAASAWGEVAYKVYRASTRAATPLIELYLQWRRLRGLEHPARWPERLGRPSALLPSPSTPLLWFHAVSLGEGLAAIPVIKHCIRELPHCTVLMTTTTASAFEVIKDKLPHGVIYQFAPVDIPGAVEDFLNYWNPYVVFLMESELWPNLIISASEKGIAVALLNARMSSKSFMHWSRPVARSLISFVLSKLSLIAALSTTEAVRFQLLQAPPHIISFAGDLKYVIEDSTVFENKDRQIKDLQSQITNRPVWMAASIHQGEEEVMLWVHKELVKMYPDLITIIVTRHPQHGQQIALALERQGVNVALRSTSEAIYPSTNIYVVDTLGELRTLYRVTPIAVIGGSFLPGLTGHNLSEAAAASCAVLTGPHVGHFSHMILEMRQSNCLSVLQVQGKWELAETLNELLSDFETLETHRKAAKQAYSAVANGVVHRLWDLIDAYVLKKGRFGIQ